MITQEGIDTNGSSSTSHGEPVTPTQREPQVEDNDQVIVHADIENPFPLIPILDKKEHFDCKISIKCSLNKVVETIIRELGDNSPELEWFKTRSPFGHFLDVPTNYQHSSQMMWLLLLRQVKCSRADEIWFVVNGKPIRFSLLEYALISGLRCSDHDATGLEKQGESQDFRNKHFPQNTIITIGDVERKLKEMCTTKKRKKSKSGTGSVNMDKVKMAMLLFVSSVLFQGDKSTCGIDPFFLGIVDDIEMFIQYPWGKVSFVHLRRQLTRSIKEKSQKLLKDGFTSSTITYTGFVFPLTILVLECIPSIANVFAQRLEHDVEGVPRICHWKTIWKSKQAPSYSDVMVSLGKSQDIIGLLIATDQELQASFMQGFSNIQDDAKSENIEVINLRELTKQLLSGRSITWHDDDVGDVDPDVQVDETLHVEQTIETSYGDARNNANTTGFSIPSPSRPCETERVTIDTSSLVTELKRYIDEKLETLENSLEYDIKALGSKLEKEIKDVKSMLESKIDSLIVTKANDNQRNAEGGASTNKGCN